jgi:hypothetical protein
LSLLQRRQSQVGGREPPPLAANEAIGPLKTHPPLPEKIFIHFLLSTYIGPSLTASDFLSPESILNQTTTASMGVQDVLTRKTGVIVGDDVLKLFNYAQEHKFAIPAIVSIQHPPCLQLGLV